MVVGDAAHLAWVAGRGPAEPDTELAEQSLADDHDVVITALGGWPGARVCQEAGPTGFGLDALLAAGSDSVVVAPALVRSRPGDRVKSDQRAARRRLACTLRAG